MLTVGFEPTRANTEHLKCSPLDQLGHVSVTILGTAQFSIGTNPRFRVLQQELNLHPVINSDWLFAVSSHTILPTGLEPVTFGS